MCTRPLSTLAVLCIVVALGACASPLNVKSLTNPSGKVSSQSAKQALTQATLREIRGMVRLTTADGVKLVGNDAASLETGRLLSNNSGSLISNNAGGLISNNAGGFVSAKGGGLAGAFALLAANGQAAPEDRLAEAIIEVIDAAGNMLKDNTGKPLRTVSDARGNYVLQANIPQQNFLLRVKLNEKLASAGSELRAMVAGGVKPGGIEVPIDSNSSLAAGYVLAEYVKGRNEVFARLPDDANQDLRRDVGVARALLGQQALGYGPEQLRETVGRLRQQSAGLDQTLERVKAILLVGQEQLGQGELATRVPLSLPIAVARDGLGNTYIAEEVAGRIRQVDKAGRLRLFAGDRPSQVYRPGITREEIAFGSISDIAVHPQGGLVVVDEAARAVYHLRDSGQVERLIPAPGVNTEFIPRVLAIDPRGDVYVSGGRHVYRIAGATVTEVTPGAMGTRLVTAIAVARDGALWIVRKGDLMRLAPGETEWVLINKNLQAGVYGRLAPAGQQDVYLTESIGDRVVRVAPNGQPTLVFGQGQPGQKVDEAIRSVTLGTMQLRHPAGLTVTAEGQILVADYWRQLVREINPIGGTQPLTTFAGLDGPATLGGREVVAVSNPFALALKPGGEGFVYAEAGSHVVRQYRSGQVTLVAGGDQWTLGKNTRAVDAALTAPVNVSYDRAGNLWVLESVSARLLKIAPDGVVHVMAGNGKTLDADKPPEFKPEGLRATEVQLGRPAGLAIGPDDQPYWSDQGYNVVCKLTKEGTIDVVVGTVPAKIDAGGDGGDGGPAAKAMLRYPLSLAFDRSGDLYIADTGNLRVRKVSFGTPERIISTFLGLGNVQTLLAISAQSSSTVKSEESLEGATTVLPVALHIDGQNNLYVAELGTTRSAPVANGYGVTLPPSFPTIPARVRRVALGSNPTIIKTVAGPGGRALTQEYGDDSLGLPVGLVVDGKGQLIVSDTLNNQIKLVPIP
jgi:streptogramin lyase